MAAKWADATENVPRLAPGDVDVWSVPLDTTPAALEAFERTLSEDEVERADRFCFERDRRRYVCARGALRELLSRYLRVESRDITFRYGTNGKPALDGGLDGLLAFNVSHSGELALIAIGRGMELGVDVEAVRPMQDAGDIAARFFAPGEHERLMSLPDDERTNAFFACWTRKEAYLKALGSGLAKPLDAFEVTFAPDEAPALLVYGDDRETARWRISDLAPGGGYAGALVTEGAATARRWRFTPAPETAREQENLKAVEVV
jgi:4'-phosphopantetheinyl transferase